MGTIRVDFAGALHHVYQRGNNKQDIFLDDDDRGFFLGYLNALKQECGFKLYAVCLMSNHFHLLVESGQVPLETIMRRLETAYAMRFNAKHDRVGYLFQGRYKAKLCSRDGYFLRLIRYIHRNPVKAGLVKRCGDYRWSGHNDLAAARQGLIDVEFPLSFFGVDEQKARVAYAAYADDTVDDGWTPASNDEPLLAVLEDISDLLRTVADAHGCSAAEVASGAKSRHLMAAKREFAQKGLDQGFSQAQLARALRCSPSTVAYLLRPNPKIRRTT